MKLSIPKIDNGITTLLRSKGKAHDDYWCGYISKPVQLRKFGIDLGREIIAIDGYEGIVATFANVDEGECSMLLSINIYTQEIKGTVSNDLSLEWGNTRTHIEV